MEDQKSKHGSTGRVNIDRVVHYSVSNSLPSLEKEFTNTILQYNSKANQLSAPIVTIPYSAIDDIVENDFHRNTKKFGTNVISIYLFNSSLPSSPYYYSNSGESGECTSSSQAGKVEKMIKLF